MATIKRGCLEQYYLPAHSIKPIINEMRNSIKAYNPIAPIVVNNRYEMPVKDMIIGAIYNVLVVERWHLDEFRLSRCILERLN